LVRRPGLNRSHSAASQDEKRSGRARVYSKALVEANKNIMSKAVCRRAFVRFKEIMAVRTSFLLDILRDLSERSGGQQRNSFAHQGLPAVSGSPSCPRLQVPDPGLIPTACTDGEDRFGAESPATGSNLENPVRRTPAPGGQDLRSAVLPTFVKRRVRTAGRNRRFPDVKTGRQPERACSGSSG